MTLAEQVAQLEEDVDILTGCDEVNRKRIQNLQDRNYALEAENVRLKSLLVETSRMLADANKIAGERGEAAEVLELMRLNQLNVFWKAVDHCWEAQHALGFGSGDSIAEAVRDCCAGISAPASEPPSDPLDFPDGPEPDITEPPKCKQCGRAVNRNEAAETLNREQGMPLPDYYCGECIGASEPGSKNEPARFSEGEPADEVATQRAGSSTVKGAAGEPTVVEVYCPMCKRITPTKRPAAPSEQGKEQGLANPKTDEPPQNVLTGSSIARGPAPSEPGAAGELAAEVETWDWLKDDKPGEYCIHHRGNYHYVYYSRQEVSRFNTHTGASRFVDWLKSGESFAPDTRALKAVEQERDELREAWSVTEKANAKFEIALIDLGIDLDADAETWDREIKNLKANQRDPGDAVSRNYEHQFFQELESQLGRSLIPEQHISNFDSFARRKATEIAAAEQERDELKAKFYRLKELPWNYNRDWVASDLATLWECLGVTEPPQPQAATPAEPSIGPGDDQYPYKGALVTRGQAREIAREVKAIVQEAFRETEELFSDECSHATTAAKPEKKWTCTIRARENIYMPYKSDGNDDEYFETEAEAQTECDRLNDEREPVLSAPAVEAAKPEAERYYVEAGTLLGVQGHFVIDLKQKMGSWWATHTAATNECLRLNAIESAPSPAPGRY